MSKLPKRRISKIRPVRISDMRVPPVGVVQRKYHKADAERYAANLDLDKLGTPIINHRNGIYWIVDGQHRIEALKMFFAPSDPGLIECRVYEDLTDAEMAELFLGGDDRRAISVFEKFLVACTAERRRETDIRRTVESSNLKISQTKEIGCVGAIGALGKVYDRAGAVVLGQTIRTIRDAFGSDPLAFDGQLIQGLGHVFNRYNGRTHERDMVRCLTVVQHGVRGIMQRAEKTRLDTGSQKVMCVAATVVDIYNKSATRQQRLPVWWKSSDEATDHA